MIYNEFYLKTKWFSESAPANPKKASATLTFTDAVVATDTVTINDVVFEFVAAAENIAEETNTPVVVGATLTSANAVAKLAEAINATLDFVVAVADKNEDENDICVISYKSVGTDGNTITVAETCTNASFGESVTKLSGGQYGTPCPETNTIVKDNNYYYVCEVAGNKDDVVWKRFAPEAY